MKLDYYQLFECFSPEALAPREKPPFYDCIRDFATTLDAQSFTNFFNARFKWHWYPVGTVRLCSFPTNGDLVEALNEKQTLAAIGYAASMCAQENGKRFISALGLLSLLCQSIKQEQPVPALTQSFMAIRELVTRNAIDVNISFWFSKVALYQINTGVVPDGYGGTFDRAGLNAPTDDSTTPLHRAARDGHRDVSELLIDKGADVNAKDSARWTPLLHAADEGHKEVAELLISKGADLEAKNDSGMTPLHGVTTKETAELLIANGADVNAKVVSGTKQGLTPLDAANETNQTEIANLIRKHGGKTAEELKAEGK